MSVKCLTLIWYERGAVVVTMVFVFVLYLRQWKWKVVVPSLIFLIVDILSSFFIPSLIFVVLKILNFGFGLVKLIYTDRTDLIPVE